MIANFIMNYSGPTLRFESTAYFVLFYTLNLNSVLYLLISLGSMAIFVLTFNLRGRFNFERNLAFH